jgi:isocitrate/isopropylmalate dehydrogenase
MPDRYRVAFIRGGPEDQTGPEMADAAMTVIATLLEVNGGPGIEFVPVEAGAHCFARYGTSVPDTSLKTILELGIVFKAPTASSRTPTAVPVTLLLKQKLRAYANVNKLKSYPGVLTALKPNIDVVLVRENSEGLLALHTVYPSPNMTVDLRFITAEASTRIARLAFETARRRRKRVTACAFPVGVNSDKLFLRSCAEVSEQFPDVEFTARKVDAFAGTVVTDPEQYDVVVAPNEWGSVMTDLFAAACGSVGLAARGNIGDGTGLFEPIHGTAPGKAGKGTVNPISQIMAGKLMLEWLGSTFKDAVAARAADRLEQAIALVLAKGDVLTSDLGGTSTTLEMTDAISHEIAGLSRTPSG